MILLKILKGLRCVLQRYLLLNWMIKELEREENS